jgi:NAD(P)-dependent dehydrogenase (short-subunit alcohol dehydrogenase family)
MGKLQGRVAIVFGAGSVGEGWGNGKATAVTYAREGAKVVCIDIQAAAAENTARVIRDEGGIAASHACDVTDAAQIDAVVSAAEREFGTIDILHNNVGMPTMGTIDELDLATWQSAFDINITSVFLTCKRVLPIMVKQQRGAIVNISSIAAVRYTGYPYPAYYASKAAVNHFTVAIALEHARNGIRANAIMPGMMDTPHIYQNISGQYASHEAMVAQRSALCPMGRMGTGWDIANAAAFLASDEAQYITGVCLPVDGGFSCKS